MRKKHDEGYALVFVLVVMVVLSIIAISLMSAALNNLESQTASVERMKAKYKAEGEIEKAVAEIVEEISLCASNVNLQHHSAVLEVQKELNELLLGYELNWDATDSLSCEIELNTTATVVQSGQIVLVHCTIVLNDAVGTNNGFYVVATPKVTYKNYTIAYLAPSETTEGGAAG